MKIIKTFLDEKGIESSYKIESILNKDINEIIVPTKTEAKIKYMSKQDLQSIHKNIEVSGDFIMLMLSFFSSTYALSKGDRKTEAQSLGYKTLNSKVLNSVFKVGKVSTYKKILDLLIKHKILEKGRSYSSGLRSNEYRLTKTYFGKGTTKYVIKSKTVRMKNLKNSENNLEKVLNCPIANNELLNNYLLNFPTDEQAKEHLIKLSKEGKKNKKGKNIIYLNKRNPKDFKDCVFVEDYLLILEYLRRMNVPIVTSDNAGERVITAFNFLPSILRSLVTIGSNGQKLVEIDYQTMHPNLVAYKYGGSNKEMITHDKVSEYLGVDRSVAKIGHLSFFNLEWDMMLKSPLFKYYSDNEAQMMENIYYEKTKNGYKETSKSCFEMETTLQRRNITDIRNKGIICFYVFDALYTIESDAKAVRDIMNKNAKKAGYLTQAK